MSTPIMKLPCAWHAEDAQNGELTILPSITLIPSSFSLPLTVGGDWFSTDYKPHAGCHWPHRHSQLTRRRPPIDSDEPHHPRPTCSPGIGTESRRFAPGCRSCSIDILSCQDLLRRHPRHRRDCRVMVNRLSSTSTTLQSGLSPGSSCLFSDSHLSDPSPPSWPPFPTLLTEILPPNWPQIAIVAVRRCWLLGQIPASHSCRCHSRPHYHLHRCRRYLFRPPVGPVAPRDQLKPTNFTIELLVGSILSTSVGGSRHCHHWCVCRRRPYRLRPAWSPIVSPMPDSHPVLECDVGPDRLTQDSDMVHGVTQPICLTDSDRYGSTRFWPFFYHFWVVQGIFSDHWPLYTCISPSWYVCNMFIFF